MKIPGVERAAQTIATAFPSSTFTRAGIVNVIIKETATDKTLELCERILDYTSHPAQVAKLLAIDALARQIQSVLEKG